MGLLSEVKTWWISHLLIAYIILISGLVVNFLMLLTLIFVWPFNHLLYRKIVGNLGFAWWSQYTFLTQWWSGSKCTVYFENPDDYKYCGKEHTIVIMNHKYETEFLMCWVLAERFGLLGGTKIYGKRSLKLVPLIGWAWTFTESIFLNREWEKDRKKIVTDLESICSYPENYWITLLLFCEGTRFTKSKHAASMEVARQKGLPELKHHLLPRTKGFVLSMQGIKGRISSILDLTIGFTKDGANPEFMSVANGKPVNAEIYLRRIPVEDIPTDTDENCAAWLHKLYQRKDEIYDNFYQNGTYTIGTKVDVPRRSYDLYMWLFWAVFSCVPLFYILLYILTSGSLAMQIGFVVCVLIMRIFMKKMIAETKIKESSSYGNAEVNSNEKKSR